MLSSWFKTVMIIIRHLANAFLQRNAENAINRALTKLVHQVALKQENYIAHSRVAIDSWFEMRGIVA